MKDRDSDFKSTVAEQRNLAKAAPSEAAKARQNDNKRAFFNEKILLRHSSLASSGEKKIGGEKWTVPRNRLTPELLQEAVNRGVGDDLSPLVVQHLFDAKTNTVISTSDARTQCRSGVCYDVISSPAGTVEDGGILTSDGEVYYNGDVVFILYNIPEHSTEGSHVTTVIDINRWLVDGAIASLEPVRILVDQQDRLQSALQQLEREKCQIHSQPVYDKKTGRAISGAELTKARETRFEDIVNEIEEKKKRLVETTRALGEEKAKHYRHCKLEIRKLELGYEVKLRGKKKLYYTSLVIDQKGWSLVPLFATGQAKGAQGKCSLILDADARQHSVDLRPGSFKIERLPDGFGVLEMYSPGDAQQILFNGNFINGHYLNGTLRTDAFTFQGLFQDGQPSKGRCSYADGTVVEGGFALPEARIQSQLGPDYRRTSPHGRVNIRFKGGLEYNCNMKNGRACKDTESTEEPMLHRSIMFRGERLYFDKKAEREPEDL
mmetsp:Transcript_12617/g.29810  ORF Transcript_12617/g.29810 Transcript_12617/m.29810 type:complete len:491 (+) Transcript_12617:207-1679(+)